MAGFANWISVIPQQGSGDGTVTVQATQEWTGRNPRSGQAQLIFRDTDGHSLSQTRTVTQKGKAEFVNFDQNAYSAAAAGQTLIVEGVSNSSKLKFELVNNNITGLTIPESYTVTGVGSVTNNTAITGDPGATAEFAFSLSLPIPNYEGLSDRTCGLKVTDNYGHTKTVTITQQAAPPSLTVTPSTIELDAASGSSDSFIVDSNVNWEVVGNN